MYGDRNIAKGSKQRQNRHCKQRGVEDTSHHDKQEGVRRDASRKSLEGVWTADIFVCSR